MALFNSDDLDSLRRTPAILRAVLAGRSDRFLDARHNPECVTPREALAHLIIGEEHLWVSRVRWILDYGESKPLPSADAFNLKPVLESADLEGLLDRFKQLRLENLEDFQRLEAEASAAGGVEELGSRRGLHSVVGTVTLSQLCSDWVAHDLYHLGQMFRDFASLYQERIGPWQEYLNIPNFY